MYITSNILNKYLLLYLQSYFIFANMNRVKFYHQKRNQFRYFNSEVAKDTKMLKDYGWVPAPVVTPIEGTQVHGNFTFSPAGNEEPVSGKATEFDMNETNVEVKKLLDNKISEGSKKCKYNRKK